MARRIFVDTEWTAAPGCDRSELMWITPDEQRLSRAEIAAAVMDFCGEVDEFWAWVPTLERFAAWFGLEDEALELFQKYWDIDSDVADVGRRQCCLPGTRKEGRSWLI